MPVIFRVCVAQTVLMEHYSRIAYANEKSSERQFSRLYRYTPYQDHHAITLRYISLAYYNVYRPVCYYFTTLSPNARTRHTRDSVQPRLLYIIYIIYHVRVHTPSTGSMPYSAGRVFLVNIACPVSFACFNPLYTLIDVS